MHCAGAVLLNTADVTLSVFLVFYSGVPYALQTKRTTNKFFLGSVQGCFTQKQETIIGLQGMQKQSELQCGETTQRSLTIVKPISGLECSNLANYFASWLSNEKVELALGLVCSPAKGVGWAVHLAKIAGALASDGFGFGAGGEALVGVGLEIWVGESLDDWVGLELGRVGERLFHWLSDRGTLPLSWNFKLVDPILLVREMFHPLFAKSLFLFVSSFRTHSVLVFVLNLVYYLFGTTSRLAEETQALLFFIF